MLKEEKKNLKIEETSPSEQKQRSPTENDNFKDIQTAVDRLKALTDLKMENKEVELGSSVDSESHMGMHAAAHAAMLEHGDSIVSTASNVTPHNDDAVSLNSEDRLSVKSSDPSIDTAIEAEEDLTMPGDLIKGISDRSQSQPDFKDPLMETDVMVKSMSTDFEMITESEVQAAPKTVEDLWRKHKGNPRNSLRDGNFFFSSPELKAQVSFSDRLSSVVCLSVCKLFLFSTSSQEPLGQFQTKLGTKHPWVKGIQFCSNEGPCPLPRGDHCEIAKIH